MERLGLGRTPVREALRDARAGEARRGLPAPRDRSSRGSTWATSRGLSEVRLVLESFAARLAAERANAADRDGRPRRSSPSCRDVADARDERDADRARPAHPSPRLPLRAQPVPRGDARASTTSSRCGSGSSRSTASRGSTTPSASTASCSRRSATATRRGAEARHAAPHRGVRAGDPRRPLTHDY